MAKSRQKAAEPEPPIMPRVERSFKMNLTLGADTVRRPNFQQLFD
jgi:hypothetical protein